MVSGTRAATRVRISPEAGGSLDSEMVRHAAHAVGILGWVRGDAAPGEPVEVHAEGETATVRAFVAGLAELGAVTEDAARVEGHEQFAVRGVSAGAFVVQEHRASAHHYDLRLEVDGVMRSWAVPKGPSLDPSIRRLAVEVGDHDLAHNTFEGTTGPDRGVIVWDRGTYEQGGRVPWPEALRRGHAVFVLHGEKLTGGFALQRTGPGSGEHPRPQWLLLKRRDPAARPGSDVTGESPASVVSGSTLADLLGDA